MRGLAYVASFAANYFKYAATLELTPENIIKMNRIGEIIKGISGDEVVNRFVDEALLLISNEEKKQKKELKELESKATEYINAYYTRAFLIDKERVDALVRSVPETRVPQAEIAMNIAQIRELRVSINALTKQLDELRTDLLPVAHEANRPSAKPNISKLALSVWTRIYGGSTAEGKNLQTLRENLEQAMQELRVIDRDAERQLQSNGYNIFYLKRKLHAQLLEIENLGIKPDSPTALLVEKIRQSLGNMSSNVQQTPKNAEGVHQVVLEAVMNGNLSLLKSCTSKSYFDVNKVTLGKTILAEAVACGKNDIVAFLLQQSNIALFPKDAQRSPFRTAAEKGDLDNLKLLIQHAISKGMDLNQVLNHRDTDGETLLDAACTNGSLPMIEYLLAFKEIDVNQNAAAGCTPLTSAILLEKLGVIKLLCADNRIKIEHPGFQHNHKGGDLRPIELAALLNKSRVVKYLEKMGAKKVESDIALEKLAKEGQSSHRDEVHTSTAKAIKKLRLRYPNVDIDKTFIEMKKYIDSLPHSENYLDQNMVAKRCFEKIRTWDCKEKITKASIQEVLALTWVAMHDERLVKDVAGNERNLIKHFALAQREYNKDKEMVDNGKEDSPACSDGIINEIVDTLDRVHPDVEIVRDAASLASTIAKEVSQKMIDDLPLEEKKQIYKIFNDLDVEDDLPQTPFFKQLFQNVRNEIEKTLGIVPFQEDGFITESALIKLNDNLKWMEFDFNLPKQDEAHVVSNVVESVAAHASIAIPPHFVAPMMAQFDILMKNEAGIFKDKEDKPRQPTPEEVAVRIANRFAPMAQLEVDLLKRLILEKKGFSVTENRSVEKAASTNRSARPMLLFDSQNLHSADPLKKKGRINKEQDSAQLSPIISKQNTRKSGPLTS